VATAPSVLGLCRVHLPQRSAFGLPGKETASAPSVLGLCRVLLPQRSAFGVARGGNVASVFGLESGAPSPASLRSWEGVEKLV
jgi:hypothetical protein